MNNTLDVLPGEGEIKTETRERKRVECDECGEPAHFRHNYLLLNPRSNPASSGYGRDDISWCSDASRYTCEECNLPFLVGYEWAATFSACKEYAHMFLKWTRKEKEKEMMNDKQIIGILIIICRRAIAMCQQGEYKNGNIFDGIDEEEYGAMRYLERLEQDFHKVKKENKLEEYKT